MRSPRYPKEEFARRGDEIYESHVRPAVEDRFHGYYVAIDIESKAYEVDKDDYQATRRLLERYPDAQIWIMRVGYRAADRIGIRELTQ